MDPVDDQQSAGTDFDLTSFLWHTSSTQADKGLHDALVGRDRQLLEARLDAIG